MTYAIAPALQTAVYARLSTDAPLVALVGAHVYDAVPPGILPPLYVALGPESVRDRSTQTGRGAEHDFSVSVVTDAAGFSTAKAAAGAVSDALLAPGLALGRGHLVALHFLRARASRQDNGATRQIDLVFRARVDD